MRQTSAANAGLTSDLSNPGRSLHRAACQGWRNGRVPRRTSRRRRWLLLLWYRCRWVVEDFTALHITRGEHGYRELGMVLLVVAQLDLRLFLVRRGPFEAGEKTARSERSADGGNILSTRQRAVIVVAWVSILHRSIGLFQQSSEILSSGWNDDVLLCLVRAG